MGKFSALTVLSVLLCCPSLSAQTQLIWQSSAGASHVQSDGVTNLTGDFIFELGTFRPPFVPTNSNTSEWLDHWEAFSSVNYNTGTQLFSGADILTTNDAPFTLTAPVYIWGRNGLVGNVEWSLISRDAWSWPDTTSRGGIGPIGGAPVFYTVGSASASDAVVGMTSGGGVQTAEVIRELPYELWVLDNFNTQQRNDSELISRLADPDNDGRSNLIEFVIGTNPNESEETIPNFANLEIIDGFVEVTVFHGLESGVDFELQFSANLTDDFEPIEPSPTVILDGEELTFRVPKQGTTGFFRVGVSLAED